LAEKQAISIGAKLKEAGRHSIIYGIGSVAQSAVGLLLLPILTGELSKDDFGVYSLIAMVTTVASAVFYLGMTSALPRSYFDYESNEDRRAIFTTAFLVLLAGALLQGTIGYLYAADIARLLVGNPGYDSVVAWALIGGALGFINQFFFAYLRLLRKSVASVIFSLITLVVTISLTFYLLSLAPASVVAPFEAIAYSQAVMTFVFVLIYGRTAFVLKIKLAELPNLLHFGAASIIASFGNMLLEWLDRLIINHYMTLADVGDYSAAFRVGMLINVLLVTPLTQIWSPMMMEYRKKENIKELFSLAFSVFMIFGGSLVILSALFAQSFLPLLVRSGVDQEMVVVFLIAAIGVLIYGATNFVAAGLFYERKVYRVSFVYYLAAMFKALANVVLIPLFGLVGAAVTALVAYGLVPVGIYSMAKKYFAFDIEWRRLGLLLVIALPSLVYGVWGAVYYDIIPLVRMLWFVVSVVLIYVMCFSGTERSSIKSFFCGILK
jgi:O-antigen/teichoic acid export membrane protein